MSSLTLATFLTALICGLLAGAFSMVEFRKSAWPFMWSVSWYDAWAAGATFLVALIVNAVFFAWYPPIFHAAGWIWWLMANLGVIALVTAIYDFFEGDVNTWQGKRKWVSRVKFNYPNAATFLALGFIGLLLLTGLFMSRLWNPFAPGDGQDRATELASRVHVETAEEQAARTKLSGNKLKLEEEGDKSKSQAQAQVQSRVAPANYPPTDQNHVPIVTPQNARFAAETKLGEAGLGSRFELSEAPGELQVRDGELRYVFVPVPNYKDWRIFDSRPGEYYIEVSAEHSGAAAVVSSKRHIACYENGRYSHNLRREIYRQFPGYFVGNLFPEVSDGDDVLHYTGGLSRTDVGWKWSTPVKAIVVDTTDCTIKAYDLPTASDPGDLPKWVDRVFSVKDAEVLMDWNGHWGAGPDKASYVVAGEKFEHRLKPIGEPGLVATNEGLALQTLMFGRKTSDDTKTAPAQKIVLMDTRTGTIRVYDAQGARVEESLKDMYRGVAIPNVPQGVPDNAGIYSIHGEWVWVGGTVPEDKVGSNESVAFGSIGINRARGNKADVVLGKTWADVLLALDNLPEQSDGSGIKAGSSFKEETVEILSVDPLVEGGVTKQVYQLVGDKHQCRFFIREVRTGNIADLSVRAHDKVTIIYKETGESHLKVESITVTEKASPQIGPPQRVLEPAC